MISLLEGLVVARVISPVTAATVSHSASFSYLHTVLLSRFFW